MWALPQREWRQQRAYKVAEVEAEPWADANRGIAVRWRSLTPAGRATACGGVHS
jgi:hypothetical protein